MGVALSPDLLNQYGYHFEQRSGILNHPDVVFYRRYIDDCLGIVYAESANDALKLLENSIHFDGCVIEWAVSDTGCQFLDSFLFKESGKLQWKPYDEVWNWFSAAELGKAVTEYWSEWYTRAENGDYSISASRPFIKPSDDEVHGLDDVKPDLFAVIPVDGEDIPFIKPSDDEVHGLDDVKPDLFAVISVNREDVHIPDLRKIGLLRSRWIVSRKRNTNLFDLANVWKKTVFRKLDENIAEEGGVVPLIQDVDEDHHSDS
ncbi:hypothetical protein CVT25_007840, partial [Psilocybe cyanescens]